MGQLWAPSEFGLVHYKAGSPPTLPWGRPGLRKTPPLTVSPGKVTEVLWAKTPSSVRDKNRINIYHIDHVDVVKVKRQCGC